MNLSGEAIKEARDFYNVKPEEIIVIYDDIDIEKGKIKLRKKGGPGSHNGMKSVVQELNTTDFCEVEGPLNKRLCWCLLVLLLFEV